MWDSCTKEKRSRKDQKTEVQLEDGEGLGVFAVRCGGDDKLQHV